MDETVKAAFDYFNSLSDDEFLGLVGRLTLHAEHRARSYGWDVNNPMPGGYEAVDIVLEAIKDLLDGTRSWKTNQYSIEDVLKGIIRSKLYHLKNSKMVEHEERITLPQGELDALLVDPTTVRSSLEDDERIKALAQEIWSCVGEDEDLELVLHGMLDEQKPKEIAADLNLPRTQVYAMIKKIYRRVRAAEIGRPAQGSGSQS